MKRTNAQLMKDIRDLKIEIEDAYDKGLLKGCEIGDAVAARANKELNEDMARLHMDRVEFVRERDKLLKQLTAYREYSRQMFEWICDIRTAAVKPLKIVNIEGPRNLIQIEAMANCALSLPRPGGES